MFLWGPPVIPWYIRWPLRVVLAPVEAWCWIRDTLPRRRRKREARYVGSGWLVFEVPWYLRWLLRLTEWRPFWRR